MHSKKRFSQACENNQQPILDLLSSVFSDTRHVLEIGSGTGQHGVFFSRSLPHLVWQTSDLLPNHASINAWISEYSTNNIRSPLTFDADDPTWPYSSVDGVFTANTAHIMPWLTVERLFKGLPFLLKPNSTVVMYGPFKYEGRFTSISNEAFDKQLRARNPHQGIRDFEAVNKLAQDAGLKMQKDTAMPANNRLLVWKKDGV